MAVILTHNAILALNSGEMDLHPFVQVLDVRQIGTGQSIQERFRLVLSDGVFVQQAMLATQLNDFVKSGQVQKGSIVKLVEYICNTVQNRKIIIVLSMEVAVSVAEIIGDPKQTITNEESLAAAATAANKQQQEQQPRPAVQASVSPLQPPTHGVMASDGYKGVPSNGLQMKESGVSSYGAPAPKPGFPGPGYGAAVNVQPPGGDGMYANGSSTGTYGRPVTAQPTTLYSNRGPIAKNEAPPRIVPIAALNPYQGRWTIKGRVTAKSDLRRYHNAKGEGKVFHFDFLDAEGGEIRATCFNNVAEQFYERVEVGKVYLLSKGSLKPAQKNYNHLKNDWEILLENSSTLEPCSEEDGSIPHQQFDFKLISEIENMEVNATVDLVGIVVAINPSTTIMRKNGTETQKRSLQLRDISGRSVEVTMWGSFCNNEGQQLQELCDSGQFPVLALKAGRITEFSGRNISTISPSQLLINPNLPECSEVKEWFERVGRNTAFLSISKEGGGGSRIDVRKTINQIKDEGLGRSEKPDWIAVRATISYLKSDSFCYTACPLPAGDRQCSKKVINNGDGTWRCDKCDKSVAECDYRYLLSIQVQDHTGVTWITAFQEAGEEIMGVSAKELYMWKQDESVKFQDLISKLLFSQHLFKLKVKEENYNDEQRVKCTVVNSERLDFTTESKSLIDVIGKLMRGEQLGGPTAAASNPVYNGYASSTPAGVPSMGPPGGGSYGGNMYSGTTSLNTGSGYGAGNVSSYGGGGVSCFKCGGGHFARECPNEKGMSQSSAAAAGGFPGGIGYGTGLNAGGLMGGSNSCYKCGQAGHWARDCTSQGAGSGSGSYGGYGGYGRGY